MAVSKQRIEWMKLYCPDAMPDEAKAKVDKPALKTDPRHHGKRRDEIRSHMSQHLHRTRKCVAVWDWSEDDAMYMLKYWKWQCAYCHKHLGPSWHADHYIPLSNPNTPGTVPWNMVPSCGRCNESKHDKHPHDWIIATFGEMSTTMISGIEAFLTICKGRRP